MTLGTKLRLTWSYGVVVAILGLSWLVTVLILVSFHGGVLSVLAYRTRPSGLIGKVELIQRMTAAQETALHTYLWGGRPSDARLYWSDSVQVSRALGAAKRAAGSTSWERGALNTLRRKTEAWQGWAEEEISLVREGGRARARAWKTRSRGSALFDRLRPTEAWILWRLRPGRRSGLDPTGQAFEVALIMMSAMALTGIALVVYQAHRSLGTRSHVLAVHDEAERAHRAERMSAERYQNLIEASPDGIIVADRKGAILIANHRATALAGRANGKELIGKPVLDLFAPQDRARGRELLRELFDSASSRRENLEVTLLGRDGAEFPAEIASSSLTDREGQVDAVTLVIRDVTDRKAFEDQLQHQALHDPLTSLPNRALLLNRLQHALLAAQREQRPVGLLLLDLDRFKEVNDTFGHHYGDLLLQELGARLRAIVRNSDTVARLGGDELAVLLPGTDEVGAQIVAEKITEALEQPFELEGHSFDIRASIGITLHPHHGSDAFALLRQADVAMYLAKRSGGGYALYSADEDMNTPRRLALIRSLRMAIEQDQLHLQYQPKVDVRTGRVDGVEALIRWRHPDLGPIPPDHFIPLAEQTGLIKPLTEWVLKAALRQCRMWQDTGLPLRVAVNLSARSLLDPALTEEIVRALRAAHVAPQYLELEITESAVMHDPRRAIGALNALHDAGIRLSIDDFGTGYSSLAYLKQLPVDQIKIDKSFVLDMTSSESDRRIVRATISLSHDLDLAIVAEGVETQEAWEMLAEFGCDYAQGHLLARPLLPVDCAEWVAQWHEMAGSRAQLALLETA